MKLVVYTITLFLSINLFSQKIEVSPSSSEAKTEKAYLTGVKKGQKLVV